MNMRIKVVWFDIEYEYENESVMKNWKMEVYDKKEQQ